MFEVDGTETVGVSEDRDLGGGLDIADQFVGTARDDEVDVLIQVEELGNHVSGCNKLDSCIWDGSCRECRGDDFRDGNKGFCGFFSAFENCCVT